MNVYTNSGKTIDYVLVLPISVPSFCPMVCKLGGAIPLAPGVCTALIKHTLFYSYFAVTDFDSTCQKEEIIQTASTHNYTQE